MARAEGDIVITVGADITGVARGAAEAQRHLGNLDKATKAADTGFKAMAKGAGYAEERLLKLLGVNDRLTKSASQSASVFEADFKRMQSAVDRLRASYDPVFAASKRYEAAVEQLDEALRRGVITQGQYATMTAKLGQNMLTADGAAGMMAGQVGKVGSASTRLTSQIQNASYQVGDFAVQIASGTAASRALAQQLPQLLGGFGMFGAVAGAAAAIGGALVPMLFGAGEAAKSFKENLDAAEATLSKMKETAAMFSAEGLTALKEKYGEVNLELVNFLELQAQIAKLDAMDATRDALAALKAELNGDWFGSGVKKELEDLFGLTLVQANNLYATMRKISDARTFDEQLSAVIGLRQGILDATGGIEKMDSKQLAFYRKVLDSENALRQLAAAAPGAGWLAAAIGQAETLAGKLWDAVAAKAELQIGVEKDAAGNPVIEGTQNTKPRRAPSGEGGIDWGTAPERKGGGGGGGKKGEDYAAKLEQFNQGLMTEAEMELAQYQTRQEQLQGFLDRKLLTQEEYNAKLEQLQQQHSDRMAAIDVYRYGDGLQKAGAFLGDMASALQGGNDKMQKIAAKFAAVETLINAWRAYSQTLADPTLPFWAKIPAAMKVLAAGFGAVNAIKGGGGGGGGAATSKPAAAAVGPAQAPLEVRLRGDGSAIGWGDLGTLLTKLNEEAGDRGYRLLVAP